MTALSTSQQQNMARVGTNRTGIFSGVDWSPNLDLSRILPPPVTGDELVGKAKVRNVNNVVASVIEVCFNGLYDQRDQLLNWVFTVQISY